MPGPVRDSRVAVRIVIGTYARLVSGAEGAQPLYEWVVVVKAAHDPLVDLSEIISTVEFGLHPSFPNARRVVKSAPFMVKEQGWGEFDISIKIHFKFPEYKPIQTSHLLRLYSATPNVTVVNERLDAICFSGNVNLPQLWPRMAASHLLTDALVGVALGPFAGIEEVGELEDAVAAEVRKELENVESNIENLKDEIRRKEEMYLGKRLGELVAQQ